MQRSITYTVNRIALDGLIRRMNKLVQKAEDLGCEPIKWTVGEEYLRVEGYNVYRLVDIVVSGTAPKFEGWYFVAVVERCGDQLVCFTVPWETVPPEFNRFGNLCCDHCQAFRRRNKTYLIRRGEVEAGGLWKQVGSTCIKDFLGHSLPKGIHSLLRAYSSDLDNSSNNATNWGSAGIDLTHFLAVTSMIMRHKGYVSRARAKDTRQIATADAVLGWFERDRRGEVGMFRASKILRQRRQR